jgi:hypothetical protein
MNRTLLHDAELGLTKIQPTTMAGVLALLAYMDDFHVQTFELPEDPGDWHSGDQELTEYLEDDAILDKFDGEPVKLPYNVWIMRNVRAALQSLATQS